MAYESYQHAGIKTLLVTLLQNSLPAIFITFVWIGFILLKIIGADTLLSFFNTPEIIPLVDVILNWALLIGFVSIILSVSLAILITCLEYFSFYFMLNEHGLCMKEGILNKKEISIPYRQIQDINIDRPFIYQILGVCKLNILTAGQDSDHSQEHKSEANFPIIDKDLAYNLRDALLSHTNVEIEIEEPTTK